MTETRPAAAPIRAVLFDLGGVIVRLGGLDDLLGPNSGWTPESFWPAWIASPHVQAFERGQASVEEFTEGVVQEFGLGVSPQAFGEQFISWTQGMFDGVPELLDSIRPGVVTATASNTNALHWHTNFGGEPLIDLFDRHYPSFELGVVKPTADYFELIIADLGLSPGEVLFLDDNQINVDGARVVGLTAEQVKGTTGASAALAAHGLTTGPTGTTGTLGLGE